MTYKKYTFSFTAASALVKETMAIAELYLKHEDWNKLEIDVVQNNVIHKNNGATYSIANLFQKRKYITQSINII